MNKKYIFLLLVCSLTINLGFAGAYGFNMFSRAHMALPTNCSFIMEGAPLYRTLGLSQTQIDRVEPVVRDFHEKIVVLREQIVGQRRQLVEEMAREHVDMEALDELHSNIAVGQNKVQQLVMHHILNMKKIMTPEQRSKFFEAMLRAF